MRSHSKALFAVAALFAFLLAPSSAVAGNPVNDFFGTTGNGNGQFGETVGGLAVNQASGDLYAFDQVNARVQRFDEDGNYLSQFGEEGEGNGQFAIGGAFLGPGGRFPVPQIAIDQSDGSVYVADHANDRIQKFEADGTFLAVIDTATGSPVSEALSGPKGVAIGTDGTLYVADTGNNRIVKFDSSGAYLSELSIPVGEGEGELSSPAGLAVDSTGAIYVYDSEFGFGGRVQKFSAAGSFEFALSPGEPLRGVATDTTNDHTFVSARNDIYEYDATGALVDTHHVDPSGAVLTFGSLAVNEGGPIYGVNLNGTSQNGTWILILDEPGIPVPSATIDPVTTFDSDSASFSGEVTPNGNGAVTWRFQVSSDGGSTWTDAGNGGTVPEGTSAEAVSTEASELEPSFDYQVRLVASKVFVTDQGIDSTAFTTDAVLPAIRALDPGPVTDASAWIGAYVNPRNDDTSYYVEYSTDPSFASSTSVPVSQDASAGSGGDLVLAIRQVRGLQPETTYHYRVVATNIAGTAIGDGRSFTTDAVKPPVQGLPDGRVWEKVSPADKASTDIFAGNMSTNGPFNVVSQASAAGDAVTFGSGGKFGDVDGGPARSQYLARRGPSGWSTEGINGAMRPGLSGFKNLGFYTWFSEDLSQGALHSNTGLNPGDPDAVQNLYLRDNDTGGYRTVSNADGSTPLTFEFRFLGASVDGGHVVFANKAPGDGNDGTLLERTPTGEVREVGILPDESSVAADLGFAEPSSGYFAGYNPISADGSHIFFSPTNQGSLPDLNQQHALYVREDGVQTTLISGSERTGDDPSDPLKGEFLAASTDGSVAYFKSPVRLTDDATAGANLYRWDSEAPLGERLTDLTTWDPLGTAVGDVIGLSDDGSSVYFTAIGADPGGDRDDFNVYVWREGEGTEFVAALDEVGPGASEGLIQGELIPLTPDGLDRTELFRPARVSPDGRFLAFASTVPATAYDTNGKSAIYLYDSETDRTVCVSCGTVSSKSKGASWFFSCTAETGNGICTPKQLYFPRNLRADGKRFFFDSRDALVPEDSNGVTDVYMWQEGDLHLISSGTSANPSRFVDASKSGDDVFFITSQQLTRSDRDDLVDVYDARVGGVPEPNVTPPCVADECQGTPEPPPGFATPSSAGFAGAGNARKAKPRCAKGKVRRKGRCTTRKARKHASKARSNRNRRAGR